MNTDIAPVCPDCGRLLIVTDNGLKLCPTEDGPSPSRPIILDGQKIDDPFAVAAAKSIFERSHDAAHRSMVRSTYPEQFNGGQK